MKGKNATRMLLVLCLAVAISAPLRAQKTSVKVDGGRIYDLIAYMADDAFLGRYTGTPEMHKCQEWAKGLFEEWGLEPGGENGTYFQAVPIGRSRTFSTGIPSLMINGREFYAKFGDFSIDTRSSTGTKIKGNLVFAGFGISAPEKGLDEYAGIDVKGKIVLALKGNPNDVPAPRGRFSPDESPEAEPLDEWAAESQDSTKIQTAYAKGAAGIILYNANPDARTTMRGRRGSSWQLEVKRDFIIVSDIDESVYEWVLWTDPQESSGGFSRRMNKLQLDIKAGTARSYDTGKKTEIKGFERTDSFGEQYGNDECRNVIGKITGSDPVLKNEHIVLGGHFDHLTMRNGQIYNGADDNASGSAVVMEVARLMKTHNIVPKRSIYFCLWTGEELGLIGSQYWVNNPTAGADIDRVVTNFNMDMVGLGTRIGAPGALNFPSIWEVIKRDQDQDIIDAVDAREGGPGGSDHSGFIRLGIEALALMTSGGGGHPDYHDTGDDYWLIDKEILRKTGQFVLQATVNLANEPGTLIIPDRQHLFDGMQWNISSINPDLEIRGGWSHLDAAAKSDLADLIVARFAELRNASAQSSQMNDMRARYGIARPQMRRANYSVGIAGPQVCDYDMEYFTMAQSILGFWRVDIEGDDGVWLNKGLTDAGRIALSALEDSSIALKLINPAPESFSDVLTAAEHSFMVAGLTEFSEEQIAQMNEKNVLVAVDFDPSDIKGCVAQLETLKEAFGDTDNLVLRLTTDEDIGTAKKELYMRLINVGWDKDAIYAIGGAAARGGRRSFGGGGGGGNLSRFGR